MRGKEYGPLNPAPTYKVVGLGTKKSPLRKVLDPVQPVQPQVASSAPATRAGFVPSTTDINSGISVRNRLDKARCMQSIDQTEKPIEKVVRVHTEGVGYIDMFETEYPSYLRKKAERERVEEARRIENIRRAEMLKKEAERKQQEVARQNAALVSSLFALEVESVARSYGLNESEIRLVQQRLTKQSLQEMPWMYPAECERFIADRDRVFGTREGK